MRFYLLHLSESGWSVLAEELTLSICFDLLEAFATANQGAGTIACALSL